MLKQLRKLLDSAAVFGLVFVLLSAAGASAAELQAVRMGVHADHTRLVLDLSAAAPFTVAADSGGGVVVIELANSAAALAALPPGQGLVQSLALERRGSNLAVLVRIAPGTQLARSAALVGSGTTPPRIFVDIAGGATPSDQASAPGSVQVASAATTLQSMKDLVAAALQAPEPEAQPADARPVEDGIAFVPPRKPAASQPGAAMAAAELQPSAGAAIPVAGVAMTPPAKPADANGRLLIAVDAGHGGKDPGAIGHDGLEEKEVTLKAAYQLKKLLEATGRYEVLLTRKDDTLIPLRRRIEIARAAGADLFISLHADHHDNAQMRGASVYTLSETASDAEAAALAARENKEDLITGVDLSHQSPMVASILIDLAQRETKNRSAKLAGLVTKELSKATRMIYDSHRFAGFAVLKSPDVPSILVELGYLSNKLDGRDLASERHRAKLAKAIRRAVDAYFEWQRGVKSS
jgi:N-acetylmuramoyl-L-alanine amidase